MTKIFRKCFYKMKIIFYFALANLKTNRTNEQIY